MSLTLPSDPILALEKYYIKYIFFIVRVRICFHRHIFPLWGVCDISEESVEPFFFYEILATLTKGVELLLA